MGVALADGARLDPKAAGLKDRSNHLDPSVSAVRLVLASSSPRRREFLRALGIGFEVRTASVDETQLPGEAPEDLAARLSRLKAHAVAAREPECWVVGADTVVAFEGEVLGKPADASDAARILRLLRGRRHRVCSGVTVLSPEGRTNTRVVCSDVWMRQYSDAEIESYIATGDPMDKAGAYAIQHPVFAPVERIDGCYANVMGLPICHLAAMLHGLEHLHVPDAREACRRSTGFPCPEGTFSLPMRAGVG
jgi:septum formation protein